MTITATEAMAILAVIAFSFGVYKWIVSRLDKRQAEYEESTDKEISDLKEKQAELKGHLEGLRTEMRSDYLHTDYRLELREDFNKVFDELRTMATGIGEINGYLKGRDDKDGK